MVKHCAPVLLVKMTSPTDYRSCRWWRGIRRSWRRTGPTAREDILRAVPLLAASGDRCSVTGFHRRGCPRRVQKILKHAAANSVATETAGADPADTKTGSHVHAHTRVRRAVRHASGEGPFVGKRRGKVLLRRLGGGTPDLFLEELKVRGL